MSHQTTRTAERASACLYHRQALHGVWGAGCLNVDNLGPGLGPRSHARSTRRAGSDALRVRLRLRLRDPVSGSSLEPCGTMVLAGR